MRKLPRNLTPVPEEEWPKQNDTVAKRVAVWRSRDYLVQAYEEDDLMMRLSVCRVTVDRRGRWDDSLTWDELQGIKHIVGFGKSWALEIYPANDRLVNVANMRHLWLLPEGVEPAFGWR